MARLMLVCVGGAIGSGARYLVLATGVAGGFTTYSAFNHETLHLLEERAFLLALAYMAGMIFLCLAAGLLGLATSRIISGALSGCFTGGWR